MTTCQNAISHICTCDFMDLYEHVYEYAAQGVKKLVVSVCQSVSQSDMQTKSESIL